MSIEHYIDKYLVQANEFVKQTFDFHIENTNNIDEFSEEFIKDFMADDNFTDLNDDLFYRHLTASKTIAQLAWNIYRAHMCHNNKCEINEKYFYQIFQNLENKEFYEKHFQNIMGKTYDKSSIIDIISRYLIIFCILHHKEVALADVKICIYCDFEVLENICSICGGDTFNYKNNNCSPMQTVTSNENKSSDKLAKINSNLNNENFYCYKDNLLHTENIGDKPNFNSKWFSKSTNEAEIFDRCLVEKNIGCNETEIDKINSQSPDITCESPLPKSYQESHLLNNNKELNKNSNSSDCILLQTRRECSLKDNVCATYNMEIVENNGDFYKPNQVDGCLVSELPDIIKDCSLSNNNIDTMNTNQWICDQCSFINNKDLRICEVCYANNQDMKYDLRAEMWNCRKCNERNPFDCYKCCKCSNLSDFFNQWVCEKCSYFNDKKARYCHVCKEKNSHLVKCSECSRSYVNQIYDDKCKNCLNKSLINKTLKDTDKNFSLEELFSKLSIKDDEDNDTMIKPDNNISVMTSCSSDKQDNDIDYNFRKSEYNYSEIKINLPYRCYPSNWLCKNPSCYCVNYKAVGDYDKYHLNKNSNSPNWFSSYFS